MPAIVLETLGTVRPDGTLDLDQKVTVPPGRVKVRVESMGAPVESRETLVEFVARARRELEAAGHKFMNEDEVTTWVEELRADDDRIENAYRQSEKNGPSQGARP